MCGPETRSTSETGTMPDMWSASPGTGAVEPASITTKPQRPASCSRTRASRRLRARAVPQSRAAAGRQGRLPRLARSVGRPRCNPRPPPAGPPVHWPGRAPSAPRRQIPHGLTRARQETSRASLRASSCSNSRTVFACASSAVRADASSDPRAALAIRICAIAAWARDSDSCAVLPSASTPSVSRFKSSCSIPSLPSTAETRSR